MDSFTYFLVLYLALLGIIMTIDGTFALLWAIIGSMLLGFAIPEDDKRIQDHAVQFDEPVAIAFQFTNTIELGESNTRCPYVYIKTSKGVACGDGGKIMLTIDDADSVMMKPEIAACPEMKISATENNPDTEYLVTNIKADQDEYFPEDIKKCVALTIDNANRLYSDNGYKVSLREEDVKKNAWKSVEKLEHPAPQLSEVLEEKNEN